VSPAFAALQGEAKILNRLDEIGHAKGVKTADSPEGPLPSGDSEEEAGSEDEFFEVGEGEISEEEEEAFFEVEEGEFFEEGEGKVEEIPEEGCREVKRVESPTKKWKATKKYSGQRGKTSRRKGSRGRNWLDRGKCGKRPQRSGWLQRERVADWLLGNPYYSVVFDPGGKGGRVYRLVNGKENPARQA
jgi:hypothetical protein